MCVPSSSSVTDHYKQITARYKIFWHRSINKLRSYLFYFDFDAALQDVNKTSLRKFNFIQLCHGSLRLIVVLCYNSVMHRNLT